MYPYHIIDVMLDVVLQIRDYGISLNSSLILLNGTLKISEMLIHLKFYIHLWYVSILNTLHLFSHSIN